MVCANDCCQTRRIPVAEWMYQRSYERVSDALSVYSTKSRYQYTQRSSFDPNNVLALLVINALMSCWLRKVELKIALIDGPYVNEGAYGKS